jgi:hypothetical protein
MELPLLLSTKNAVSNMISYDLKMFGQECHTVCSIKSFLLVKLGVIRMPPVS